MSPEAPRLLFAPYYKGGGSTEFVRAVTLAQAARRHWPAARIDFLLPGGAETRHDCPFPAAFNDAHLDKPARVTFLNHKIAALSPHLVVFDCYSAPAVLDLCRKIGARTAYVADQAGTCRRAFERRWLWRLDAHWQQREYLTAPAFTKRQLVLAAMSSTKRASFDCYFDEEPFRIEAFPVELHSALARPFALFMAGGGGYRVATRPVGDVFYDAAEQFHSRTGIGAITVLGPLHPGPPPSGATALTRSLPLSLLVALMRRAALVVTNGATGALHQALTCGAACVAAALGGADQPDRIARYERAGLVQAADLEVDALADGAANLVGPRGDALRRKVAALHSVNGIPLMIELMEEQLRLRAETRSHDANRR